MSDELLTLGELASPPASTGSGFRWLAEVTVRCDDGRSIDEQIAEATPDNDTLLEWAARPSNQPPQSWWDETEDPFRRPDD